ncbi:MAG: hypothetical protein VX493_03700 [Candidatus Thermoplasmatota archaeon]|jgi:hypothetical protein|nr:hypothetical protein [Euryarchaeota archaeon]MAM99521.1 hypothetical protein [Euryarchaeota archaeon]MBJ32836.1 hypothetical protein [Euryarchaeota archaeon]MBO53924.1 hypothetical protein [Euryarchaeota archaeon]MED5452407.1 hypothetical protein [Candidatus Thermoplasmatota archaeon]|tara:strand:+ start:712 stop:1257 length:546 start_codon:yes stop_codon:yes gene_type:complete
MDAERVLLIGAAVATVAFVVVALWQPEALEASPDWEVSDGCLGGLDHADVGISEHYHPNLKVIVDGQQLAIPENTGIDQFGCEEGMRWIHVHDSTNTGFTKLHIETPKKYNVPVGAFFEVWEREGGPSITPDKEFDINRNGVSDWEEYDISMNVNGESNDKFENYIMNDNDQIELILTSKS